MPDSKHCEFFFIINVWFTSTCVENKFEKKTTFLLRHFSSPYIQCYVSNIEIKYANNNSAETQGFLTFSYYITERPWWPVILVYQMLLQECNCTLQNPQFFLKYYTACYVFFLHISHNVIRLFQPLTKYEVINVICIAQNQKAER